MNAPHRTYAISLSRALFSGLEQAAGPSSLASVLDTAGLGVRYTEIGAPTAHLDAPGLTFQEIAAFSRALEETYGTRGGRGIALRTGNGVFNTGLRGYGSMRGVTAPQFRQLPTDSQAHITLLAVAAQLKHLGDHDTRLEDDRVTFRLIVDPSPFAWERAEDGPVCHVITGVVAAALRWATNGHEFAVYETSCRAAGGDACVFQINKRPVGRV